jgi:hypothetical protein
LQLAVHDGVGFEVFHGAGEFFADDVGVVLRSWGDVAWERKWAGVEAV